jgi:hypothetical protein
MDDAELDRLPETYALALRLADAGLDEAAIARALELEPAAAAPLLTLARTKLAALPASTEPTTGPGPSAAHDRTEEQ